ncbi:MAG TPA: hypothetical protein VKI44_11710, partial [Acetobacteraceae bacterium]|nr:hypothetical protein [Acetobacteraceae bacterium]
MYIEAVPNRNSPPAILLRESYREGGKVRKRTLCNLSDWPAVHIEGLRGLLKGGTVIPAERDAFTVIRTLPHGHVAAALGTARRIGLDGILGPDGIEVFDGNTADPMTLATQIEKIKQRFSLDHVVLVGDRRMITQARITADFTSAGLDWITSLRAPVIRALLQGGALQLSL